MLLVRRGIAVALVAGLSACGAGGDQKPTLVAYHRDLFEADHLYLARCSEEALKHFRFNSTLPFKTGLDLTIAEDERSARLVSSTHGETDWEARFVRAGSDRAVVSVDAAASQWGDESGIALVPRAISACADRWKALSSLHKT